MNIFLSINSRNLKIYASALLFIIYIFYFTFFNDLYSYFNTTTGLFATLTAGIFGFVVGRAFGVFTGLGFFVLNQFLYSTYANYFTGASYFGQAATLLLPFLTGSIRNLVDKYHSQSIQLIEEKQKLKIEIESRKAIESKLISLTNSLEDIVRDRTTNLEKANESLSLEIEKRKQVQNKLENHFNYEKLISLISKRLISSNSSLDDDIKYILEIIGQYTDADHCYLYFLSDNNELLINKNFYIKNKDGDKSKFLSKINVHNFTWLYSVISYSQGIIVKSLDDFPPEAEKEKAFFSTYNIQSLCIVPFVIENEVKGFLGLDYFNCVSFHGEELPLLNTISELLSIVFKKNAIEIQLISNENFLDTLLNSIHIGIIIVDPATHSVLDVNAYGLKMFGYKKEEMIGHTCHRFICSAEEGFCPITDLGGEVDFSEKVIRRSDNSELPILKSVIQTTKDGKPVLIESFTDISEIKKVENAIRESEQKLKLIFNSLDDVIYSINKNYELVFINESVENILHYSPEELIGKKITELEFIAPENSRLAVEYIDKVFNGETLPSFMLELRTKDGKKIIGEVIYSRSSFNNSETVISVARNVTKRLEDERKLKSAHENLIKLNQKLIQNEQKLKDINLSKDKFFSIISHDLRSPFMGLLGLSNLLNNDFKIMDNDEKVYIIDSINRSIKKVYELLDNLLQWSRIQTGSFVYNPESFNLYLLIKKCIDLYEANIFQKRLDIDLSVDYNVEAYADVKSIEAVIQNLISNAIKFSFNGGVITINCYNEGDKVITEIIDKGVGIYEADIDKIFALEENYTTLGTNQEVGSGLGLILCKEHLENNGGSIKVTSKINYGSNFSFTLPRSSKRLQN